MKRTILLLLCTISGIVAFGQAAAYINYQAALRNGSGQALANQAVTLRLGIYKGPSSALKVYEETHSLTTNAQGVVNCQIGKGNPTMAGSLSGINWGADVYNLKAEVNSGGGFLELGIQQLISVPYALYSNQADSSRSSKNSAFSAQAQNSILADSSRSAKFSTQAQLSNKALNSNRADSAFKYFGTITPDQITSGGASSNQLLRWNGSKWAPSNENKMKPGRGIIIGTGDSIHSVWTASGSNIFNNNSANTGIGINIPESKLHIQETNGNSVASFKGGLRFGFNNMATYSTIKSSTTYGAFSGLVGYAEGTSLNADAPVGVYAKAKRGKYTFGIFSENIDSTSTNSFGIYNQSRGSQGGAYALYNDVSGHSGNLVYGLYNVVALTNNNTTGYGIYSQIYNGPVSGTKYAGYFSGNVQVVGVLSKSSGTFRIDHPQDPENKYLVHSFVESPDMMNVYNGNVVTGADGKAVVTLPTYFETLNRDFRYQLTVIGQPAQAWVLEEIKENRFSIQTDKPNVKVSWQVTGVRQDPWAQEHPVVVEEEKKPHEKGKYLTPELYGKPENQGIHYHKVDVGNIQKP